MIAFMNNSWVFWSSSFSNDPVKICFPDIVSTEHSIQYPGCASSIICGQIFFTVQISNQLFENLCKANLLKSDLCLNLGIFGKLKSVNFPGDFLVYRLLQIFRIEFPGTLMSWRWLCEILIFIGSIESISCYQVHRWYVSSLSASSHAPPFLQAYPSPLT